jgi:hypothetical protein
MWVDPCNDHPPHHLGCHSHNWGKGKGKGKGKEKGKGGGRGGIFFEKIK